MGPGKFGLEELRPKNLPSRSDFSRLLPGEYHHPYHPVLEELNDRVLLSHALRRIVRIRLFNRVSNVEVLKRARAGMISISDHITKVRLRWYGHVVRMPEERLPN